MKDIDGLVLPKDPLLNHTYPSPLSERGNCGGKWEVFEDELKDENDDVLDKDCYADEYTQPLSLEDSKVKL